MLLKNAPGKGRKLHFIVHLEVYLILLNLFYVVLNIKVDQDISIINKTRRPG